jgi:hypothetical protein
MKKTILAIIFVFATLLSFSQADDAYIKGVIAIDTVIQTKVQLLKAEVATKNSNFYHNCSNTDIGNYLVTTTISAIDLHYLQENMMGTLFIESTNNCSVSITGFIDDGNSKVARTYGTNAIDLKAGEATSITYSCFKADDDDLVLYLIGSVMPLVDRVAPIWEVGLVSWYQFEETTGLTTADSYGTNNGTIDGALLGHTGKIGQCFNYDTHARVDANSNVSYPFTINVWYKSKGGGSRQSIVSVGDASDNSYHGITWDKPNSLLWARSYDGTTVADASTGISNPTSWHMYTGVFESASSRTIYIDGVEKASNTITVTSIGINSLVMGFNAGNKPYGGAYGWIDELMIYDTGISQDQIDALWNNGNGVEH